MITNSQKSKISKFMKTNRLHELQKDLKKFFDAGLVLKKKDIDILLNLARYRDVENFSSTLHDLIKNDFIYCDSAAAEKDVTLQEEKSVNQRVRKHREITKSKGYKNISLQLPTDVHKKLKDLKVKKMMTYAEVIAFLMSSKI